ncbi:paired amphipathic helix protein Sin3b isoform X2 [Spodoptera frugiperda]|uniref:Paired amphipathic helix protein Sin3b n=1 Tax=Spodoptera frugiperda TaxID=7108 RepID=A0A9R0F313_SPOFR|nr:paired amphipathic helix protein Sin3b isoform X2 [Spodoptera frugiperda]
MMKRTGVPRLGPDEPAPLPPQNQAQIQQAGASNMHTLAQSPQPQILDIRSPAGPATLLSVGGSGSFARTGARPSGGGPVINYLKTSAVQYAAKQPPPPQQVPQRLKQALPPQQPNLGALPAALGRQSPAPAPLATPPGVAVGPGAQQQQAAGQFQRLKVEDALSYLDQVKYKFNTQPQVYNDFLDIMKEFKSQTLYCSIDTPGVITRVSNLFKGHPELIVGFNTFLPPGYKIEVQSNGQVSVSMPSPTGFGGSSGGGSSNVLLGVQHPPPPPQPQLVHLLPVAQEAEKEAVRRAGGPYSNMEMSVNNAIVHNLSVNAAPTNTLHQISQAHQQLEAAAIHHASGPGSAQPANPAHPAPAPPSQPVEFNHAIEYVNKIKSRFSRQPDKYKRFLEILHAYQRGHREMKEPQAKQQTEQEVYSQVAKLFENQDDLLAEFGQFLPDAKAVTKPAPESRERHYPHVRSPPVPAHHQSSRVESESERFPGGASPPHAPHAPHAPIPHHLPHHHHAPQLPKHTGSTSSSVSAPPQAHHHLKRSPSFTSSSQMAVGAPPAKKSRLSGLTGATVRDVSYAEASKLATVHEFNFFDRARKALRSQHVYDNFLRCLLLFTNEIISSSELLSVTAPFLCRHPELQKWLQDFLGPPSPPHTPTNTLHSGTSYNSATFGGASGVVFERERPAAADPKLRYEPIGPLGAQLRHDRPQGDAAMDIDLSTCKRLGTSYCALPREAAARRCSGRTALCREVLNDTWVSFPTWSEDSTFVTSRKTQYEEYIYRCEDERFELDVVIETNASTIRVLEGVQKKLARMTTEDAAKYRLDDCLGGHSPTIHQRALRRIYGDKAVDIIAGLKKNPVVAVPVVLRRLKAKEDEWREAQKGFNKQWREQNEKYYLKSLDHQGINFKQNDLKAMRSKSLFNEVESAFAARRPGPHVVVDYNMQSRQEAIKILRDTAELLIHHARRQTAIQKTEKRRIKQLLRHFLPDLFAHPRQPLSDDERDEEEKDEAGSPGSPTTENPEDKNTNDVKQEKQESSESDNASDKSGKNNKNKENKPKNNNNTDSKESSIGSANSVKRTSSNEEMSMKTDIKSEPQDVEEDYRDHPPNEARFVCTSSWYLFLRVHGALCQRLGAARRAAAALQRARNAERPARPPVAHALRLRPSNLPAAAAEPAHYYAVLLDLVRAVLDGNMDAPAYEDAAREMLGIKAYPAYTLDKLVSIAVRQLQHCVADPWSVRAADLARSGMRGPHSYVRRAARLLRHDHSAFLVKLYGGDSCRVTFELLAARAPPDEPAWRYRPSGAPPPPKPVFLRRNARARAPGYTHNAHSQAAPAAPAVHARRKPPECGAPRLLAFRPLQLYRRGCLAAARASQPRQAARRRDTFRAWLRDRAAP